MENQIQNIITDFQKSKSEVLVIFGPTASGKTKLSIEIAKKINAEIIGADSRQIYRGMDVGTGKVTKEEMQGIPHHMIDIVDPDEKFTVGDFKERAEKIIEDILERNKVPIVVGGTGLYINSLLFNYSLPQEVDPKIRLKLERELGEKGIDFMYEELTKVDPKEALRLHEKNPRYIIRALEIFYSTNKPKSEIANISKPRFKYQVVVLDVSREILYEKINQRHKEMFDNDEIIKETQNLLQQGYDFHLESMSSIGYREVGMYLRGEISKQEAILRTQTGARNYAKRQITWGKKIVR